MGISEDIMGVVKSAQQAAVNESVGIEGIKECCGIPGVYMCACEELRPLRDDVGRLRDELIKVEKLLANQLAFNEMLKRNIRNLEAR